MEQSKRSEMLTMALEALSKSECRWTILHGYEGLPHHIDSDVDMIVEPITGGTLKYVASRMPSALSLVQVLTHEQDAHYCVIAGWDESRPVFIQLDMSYDYRRNGRVFLSGNEVLASRQVYRNMSVASSDVEFIYYLVKKVAKKVLAQHHATRLSAAFRRDPGGGQRQLERFFPPAQSLTLTVAATTGNWAGVTERLGEFRDRLLLKAGRANPFLVVAYWLGDVLRRIARVLRPTGLTVAVFGPDGSGKSTVCGQVRADLAQAFRRTALIHLRPRLTGSTAGSGPVTDPHAQRPRGALASTVKLLFWWLDYTLGTLISVFPKKVQSTLVIFDRYYDDILVDSRRYRYGGPEWLARFIGKIVPRPDLFILLDAPENVLQARKQEVPPEESRRQRQAYLDLFQTLPNAHVVDASLPPDAVAAQVDKIILQQMALRVARRLRLQPSGS